MTPSRFYIIASTPRTGSSLLCDVLDATGIAGYPQEFFSPIRVAQWRQTWGLATTATKEDFWRASLRYHTTPNGWHGVKIHSNQLRQGFLLQFAQERGIEAPWDLLARLYPEAVYIRLRRQDLRGQALSYFRAKATGAWCLERPGYVPRVPFVKEQSPPAFDGAQVLAYEQMLRREEQAWDHYFTRTALVPLELTYEALCRDIQGAVSQVLRRLGLPTTPAYFTAPPRLRKQADAVTLEWRGRMEEVPHGDGYAGSQPRQ